MDLSVWIGVVKQPFIIFLDLFVHVHRLLVTQDQHYQPKWTYDLEKSRWPPRSACSCSAPASSTGSLSNQPSPSQHNIWLSNLHRQPTCSHNLHHHHGIMCSRSTGLSNCNHQRWHFTSPHAHVHVINAITTTHTLIRVINCEYKPTSPNSQE